MIVGYTRVSKTDTPAVLDVERRALLAAGVTIERLYEDRGFRRSRLDACLKILRPGDVLVVWKLHRLGRGLRHLVNLVHLTGRGIGLNVLTGEGAAIDTTTANGREITDVFTALVEFERNVAIEDESAKPAATVARVWRGGARRKLTVVQLRLMQLAMSSPETSVRKLCAELDISRMTLYRHVDPSGELRPHGVKLLRKYEQASS